MGPKHLQVQIALKVVARGSACDRILASAVVFAVTEVGVCHLALEFGHLFAVDAEWH